MPLYRPKWLTLPDIKLPPKPDKPVTKVEGLTPEQEACVPAWKEWWTAVSLTTQPGDFVVAEQGVRGCYTTAKLPQPIVILRCGSPLAIVLGGPLGEFMIVEYDRLQEAGRAEYVGVRAAWREALLAASEKSKGKFTLDLPTLLKAFPTSASKLSSATVKAGLTAAHTEYRAPFELLLSLATALLRSDGTPELSEAAFTEWVEHLTTDSEEHQARITAVTAALQAASDMAGTDAEQMAYLDEYLAKDTSAFVAAVTGQLRAVLYEDGNAAVRAAIVAGTLTPEELTVTLPQPEHPLIWDGLTHLESRANATVTREGISISVARGIVRDYAIWPQFDEAISQEEAELWEARDRHEAAVEEKLTAKKAPALPTWAESWLRQAMFEKQWAKRDVPAKLTKDMPLDWRKMRFVRRTDLARATSWVKS